MVGTLCHSKNEELRCRCSSARDKPGQTRLASAGLSVAPTIAFPLLAQSIFVEAGFPQILTDLLARRPRLGLAGLTIPATIAVALLA
jgi:hypothetical protein